MSHCTLGYASDSLWDYIVDIPYYCYTLMNSAIPLCQAGITINILRHPQVTWNSDLL
jgi:hypothetical protein